MGGKNIRYAARLLFADPRLIPVLMLEADVPELALLKELLQGVSQIIVGVRLQPIARLAVRLVMVAVVAVEDASSASPADSG